MTADQLAALQTEINAGLDLAAQVGEVIAPQYTGFIVLGQAVAKAFPGIIADVQALIHKTEPTAADVAALAATIAALGNPESL